MCLATIVGIAQQTLKTQPWLKRVKEHFKEMEAANIRANMEEEKEATTTKFVMP